MTVEEKRQKIKEHCNRMHDCSDCDLRSVDSNCFKCVDGHIYVCCRRFLGTIQDFENKVKKTRGNPQYVKECLACLPFVKIHFEEDMK